MAEPVRFEPDPTVETPELEVQASAKGGDAWRLSYRRRGSGDPWTALPASDPGLDDILRRGGFRRVGGSPAPQPEPPEPAAPTRRGAGT